MDEWQEFFGRPADKSFRDGARWWSRIEPNVAFAAEKMGTKHPTDHVQIYAVYAYPDRVAGGQKYDVCVS